MIIIHLDKLLLNMFQEDINQNDKNTYISQIGILTIKSLFPDNKVVGNRINYERFYEELKLWEYYRIGENPSLLNILNKKNGHVYFGDRDDSICFRAIPIIVANKDFDIIEEEIIKNILFTTGNISDLLEWVLLSKIIYMMVSNQDNILENIKDYIIKISQIDLLDKYEGSYTLPLTHFPGNFTVDFEKERVDLISLLNGIVMHKYYYLNDILGIINGENPRTYLGNIIYNARIGFSDFSKLNNFYHSMNTYTLRLGKGRISPEALTIDKYILPDVFSFEENEVFFHSLLNNSKVIKKEMSNNTLISLIKTKTGMYTFKKNLV